ncbi:hypothetical protein [Psychromonas ingrahamii]|uniref:hypothetical protein n=1 Tax=Psychromonas ingrahamii TaxID=357794 RepID=UPI0002D9818D|nr:hypothetical protein [Psychromonas ingrahamii]
MIHINNTSSYLDNYRLCKAVEVALHLLKGGAYLQRINQLKMQGVKLAQSFDSLKLIAHLLLVSFRFWLLV